jgi:hypothetical protein
MEKAAKLEGLFVRGEHKAILEQTIDCPEFRRPEAGLEYLIASLCFVGRLPEALTLYSMWEPHMSAEALAASQAYLSIAQARAGQLEQALVFIRSLGKFRREHRLPLVNFYYEQAQTFYYWRRHRLRLALQFAERALDAAWRSEFFFGRALATDIMGHLLVDLGQVQRGMAALEKAHQYFTSLGYCQYVEVIETALIGYQLEFNPYGTDALANLRQRIDSLNPETNNYTLSFLYTELGHQLALRGDLIGAGEALEDAGSLIQRYGLKRDQGWLLFRKAYLSHLSGKDSMALQYLNDLIKPSMDAGDEDLLVKARGLQQLVGLRLGMPVPVHRSHASFHRKYGYAVAERINRRQHGQKETAEWAQDVMGDFLDSLQSHDLSLLEKIQAVLKSGLLSFLPELLSVPRTERVLYFEVEPQTLILFDHGSVYKAEGAVTTQMQKFVRLLIDGPKTKAELVHAIWGYAYHPLRHDPLIYGLVYRLRSLLGLREDWIQAQGDGYSLRPDINVQFFQLYANISNTVVSEEDTKKSATDLNIRQLRILQYLQQHETIDIQGCVELFQTSKVTASRDLSNLTERGLLMRTGKGRNTCYGLPKNIDWNKEVEA